MTNLLKALGLVVVGAVVGALVAVSFGASKESTGGVYNAVNNYFSEGISVGKASQFAVSSTGALTTSGALSTTGDVTTSSDFVSTKAGLCFNFYATSTATLGKMTASTTATIEGVDGVMMFSYGSCQS
jgi:hypothetical protein